MMEQKQNSSHHVAWADRVGFNKQWFKDWQRCSETFGTSEYENSVNRFRNDIINIKGGPQLKTIIDKYVDNELSSWKQNTLELWMSERPEDSQYDGWIRDTQMLIDKMACEKLCNMIVQLLEDNGFGFYESSIEEDEMS